MRELTASEITVVSGAGIFEDIYNWIKESIGELVGDAANGCYILDYFTAGSNACETAADQVAFQSEMRDWTICLADAGIDPPQTPSQISAAIQACGPMPVPRGSGNGGGGEYYNNQQ